MAVSNSKDKDTGFTTPTPKTIVDYPLEFCIWENNGKFGKFYTITIDRYFTGRSGKVISTKTFRIQDIPKLLRTLINIYVEYVKSPPE